MSRSVLALSRCVIPLLLFAAHASGQAAAEAGLGAASSSIGTAGARGAGKSIGGVFRNLDETLKSTNGAGSSKTESPAASRSAKPTASRRTAGKATPGREKPAPVSYEDAAQIQSGIGYEELLRRFGPPAMQISSGNDTQTLSYVSNGAFVQLELQGGKVVSVTKPKSGA